MDNFYRKENIEIFRKWVYFQVLNDSRLRLEEYDSRTYKIFYKNKVARFVVWPIGIIEEGIMEDDNILFYLHYQFHTFHYAMDLFYRFIIKLTEDTVMLKKKILLCCTGGMTTGYFAQKMTRYCQLNHLPYEVDATASYHLDKIYHQYSLILLAPQLRYRIAEFSQVAEEVKVLCIDPITFATYDCQSLLQQIKENVEVSDE